jgi:hypothetical protein
MIVADYIATTTLLASTICIQEISRVVMASTITDSIRKR